MNLSRWHDASSRFLFSLAGLALASASILYLFEVIARYVFDSPTTWSGEVIQYCLAILIFFALPDLSRRSAHISIDIIHDYLPMSVSRAIGRAGEFIAFTTCAIAGWIIAGEAMKQFESGLLTNAAHPIPRWLITTIIAIGLVSASLHFLRHSLEQR